MKLLCIVRTKWGAFPSAFIPLAATVNGRLTESGGVFWWRVGVKGG